MDAIALRTLNILLGNDPGDAAIELALTGGVFAFQSPSTFAIGGAESAATLGTSKLEPYRVYRAVAGDILTIENLSAGRFCYFALGGGVDAARVLGSRSTYLPGGFGGIGGRRLKAGDTLGVGARRTTRKHQVVDSLPDALRPKTSGAEIRFIARSDESEKKIAGVYHVSPSSDRTGYRLEGATREGGASVTSEPVCPGVIQLPQGGEPIILMADAPTIGGYRVMGGVISADLGILAQKLPGARIELLAISVERAQRELEKLAEVETQIEEWCLS